MVKGFNILKKKKKEKIAIPRQLKKVLALLNLDIRQHDFISIQDSWRGKTHSLLYGSLVRHTERYPNLSDRKVMYILEI